MAPTLPPRQSGVGIQGGALAARRHTLPRRSTPARHAWQASQQWPTFSDPAAGDGKGWWPCHPSLASPRTMQAAGHAAGHVDSLAPLLQAVYGQNWPVATATCKSVLAVRAGGWVCPAASRSSPPPPTRLPHRTVSWPWSDPMRTLAYACACARARASSFAAPWAGVRRARARTLPCAAVQCAAARTFPTATRALKRQVARTATPTVAGCRPATRDPIQQLAAVLPPPR